MTFKAYGTKGDQLPPFETVSFAHAQSFADEQAGWVENPDGTVVYGRKPAGVIKLEPKWRGVLPLLIEALTNGTDEGKRAARIELARMAEAADAYNASIPKSEI